MDTPTLKKLGECLISQKCQRMNPFPFEKEKTGKREKTKRHLFGNDSLKRVKSEGIEVTLSVRRKKKRRRMEKERGE